MLTIEAVAKGHPFFAGMQPCYIEELVQCAKYVYYSPGELVFQTGGQADYFFMIGGGRVSLNIPIPNRGVVPIMTIYEGDVLGWSWLFPPYLWQFDARALEPVQAVAFDAHCLRERCEYDHELGHDLMRRFAHVMVQRLQATRMQLLDVYALNP